MRTAVYPVASAGRVIELLKGLRVAAAGGNMGAGSDAGKLEKALAYRVGGAIGNVYDRVVHGYVVDFLHFYWQDWHFPAFNLADTAITIGAAMMIIDAFRKPADDSGNADRSN